ncbi:MAG: hypothetical protein KDB14_33635 [Planctomycetales bacterium]|nr:hypothetical protein [Planctomycetales bacterium]
MTDSITAFRCSGRDTMPQFTVFLLVFGGGCIPIPFMVYDGFGFYAVAALFAFSALVAVGMRFSIAVDVDRVVLRRTWFGIPYWTRAGRRIEDVYYGGDWGEAEGASGVVVVLDGGREFHIGSAKSMRHLHEALGRLKQLPDGDASRTQLMDTNAEQ